MFGTVIKKKSYTPCHNIVKTCLIKNQVYSEAINYGHAKEHVAIQRFENKCNLKVEKSGLWVDLRFGFLGASPDGIIIGGDGILEVKCIYSARNLDTMEDVLKLKTICLEKKDSTLRLKRNHSYYYQIQGQLNITKKNICYFVVYINDKIDLFVEKITKDSNFWEEKMLPKLIDFYTNCIAPEIILNNIGQGKRCKDPLNILNAIKENEEKKKKMQP
ncbi:hypothetical protein RI129_006284 [Pyrocoelia pectoralis]|uniref:YqaJ viral recombinase domain-containing protein n=1 Tax=Pyrocoelia pectoralis TaxID=417401 RepID=A0AAN7VJK1_9COLE